MEYIMIGSKNGVESPVFGKINKGSKLEISEIGMILPNMESGTDIPMASCLDGMERDVICKKKCCEDAPC